MIPDLSPAIGNIPYRLALAGAWIDQPFVSQLNPEPPGSMVVVALEPGIRFMERSGMGTGTRHAATRIWGDRIPDGDPWDLMRELYYEENKHLTDPSGSQDMAGLLFPGISRLDYDAAVEGGVFPSHIESCVDPDVAEWLGQVIHMIALCPRPAGYYPLEVKNLKPELVAGLGNIGRECYEAILARDVVRLGASFNECMRLWVEMLPHVVYDPLLPGNLMELVECYQRQYHGSMTSAAGVGYLLVASEEPVPGSFQIRVRTK